MNFRRLAVMVFAGLSLTACLGEGIDVDTTVVSHPWLSVEHVYRGAGFNEEDFGYVDDELTGFTVHLTEADAAKHGIASPLPFVGISAGRANVDADMTAYGTDATHEQWGCFEPIEIRDPNGETTVVVEDFCPVSERSNPRIRLRVIGDIITGNGNEVFWIYDSPDGVVDSRSDEE